MKLEHIGSAVVGIVSVLTLCVLINKAEKLGALKAQQIKVITLTNYITVTNLVNKKLKPRTESDGTNYHTYTNFEGRVWRYKSN
jgi:hypothetical protein